MTDKTNKVGEVLRSLPEVGDVVEMIPNRYYYSRVGDRFTIVNSSNNYATGENAVETWNIFKFQLDAYKLIKIGGVNMSVRNKYIKVGDKLRYLGGDTSDISGGLIEDEEYVVKKIDRDGDYVIENPHSPNPVAGWIVSKDGYNSECFELVGEEGEEEEGTAPDDVIDMIVKLSQEVAKLRRELTELSDAVQEQKHEDNVRIEMLMDDIVMLDERTQDDTDGKLVRKEVYIFDEK